MKARIIEVPGHVHNYERYEHGNVTYIVAAAPVHRLIPSSAVPTISIKVPAPLTTTAASTRRKANSTWIW